MLRILYVSAYVCSLTARERTNRFASDVSRFCLEIRKRVQKSQNSEKVSRVPVPVKILSVVALETNDGIKTRKRQQF